jgi:hypothetical protein
MSSAASADPHVEFSIIEARKLKEEREKSSYLHTNPPSNEMKSDETEKENVGDAHVTTAATRKASVSILEIYQSLLQDYPFFINSVQSAGLFNGYYFHF